MELTVSWRCWYLLLRSWSVMSVKVNSSFLQYKVNKIASPSVSSHGK